jgi:N-acetylmuramoyl-L-alanine amidase
MHPSVTPMRRAMGAGLLLCALLIALLAAACTAEPVAVVAVPTNSVATPEAANPGSEAVVTPETSTPAPTPTVEASPTAAPTPSATPTSTPTTAPTPTHTPAPTRAPYVVVIDPGHGGRDLGARRFNDEGRMVAYESQINLELGLLLRDELERRGFRVVMTRDGDYAVNADDEDIDGNGELDYTVDESQKRVDIANEAGADLLLSLHLNGFEYPDGRRAPDVGGSQTFYCADRRFGDDNHRFAVLVHRAMLAAFADLGYDIHDRGVTDDYYLVTPDSTGQHIIVLGPESERIVRPSQMPGALSEPLYITHAVEGDLAQDPAVLARLAAGYADAIEAFFRGEDPRE